MTFESFLSHFRVYRRNGDGSYKCFCPSHDDKNASLNIRLAGIRILVRCYAKCGCKDVLTAVGLKNGDLFTDEPRRKEPANVKKTITCVYRYTDENDAVLYENVRTEPKGFFQRVRRRDGGYDNKLNGVRRVPYHLPDIIKHKSDIIYIVEGEKDADTLREKGLLATTTCNGANGWRDEYGDFFAGRNIIIMPDCDDAGRNYAKNIIKTLRNKASNLRLLELPRLEEKEDTTDWFEKRGGSVSEILALVEKADCEFREKSYPLKTYDDKPATKIEWLVNGILPLGECIMCIAEEKTGKSWLLFQIAISLINGLSLWGKFHCPAKGKTLLYSPEGGNEAKRRRLWGLCWGLNVNPRETLKHIKFIPDNVDLSLERHVKLLEATIKNEKPDLFIIDPLITVASNIDENKSNEIQKILGIIRGLTKICPRMTILIAHHVSKNSEGRSLMHAMRGSSAISAWSDGAMILRRQNNENYDSPVRIDFRFRDAPSPGACGFTIKQLEHDDATEGVYAFKLEECETPELGKITARLNKDLYPIILEFLRQNEGNLSRRAAADVLGWEPKKFNRYIDGMVADGLIDLNIHKKIYVKK